MLIEINRPNYEVKPAFSAPNNLLIQALTEKTLHNNLEEQSNKSKDNH